MTHPFQQKQQQLPIIIRQLLMNKKQKRLQLIQYFLNISKAQEEIQTIQNQIISHMRFNPLYIYIKISENEPVMKRSQLKIYIEKHTIIKDKEIIKKYLEKHGFQSNIDLNSFTLSLLPYTPNILREATEKIGKQMETKYLDYAIEDLYHKMLQAELKSIYQACVTQKQLDLSWENVKKLIEDDVTKNGKKIDTKVKECYNIINIRKWLQLWINIDEYKILNIMRWFGGYEENHMRIMQDFSNVHLFCTCKDHSLLRINSNQTESNGNKNYRQSSETNKQLNKVKSQKIFSSGIDYYLKKFAKYIQTIVKSERSLEILRNNLAPYRRDVQLIMHSIISKKHNFTKISKIIKQIEIALKLKTETVDKMRSQLQVAKIDNNLLFSLFQVNQKTVNFQTKSSKENIIIQVYQVLYTFCLCKATLKSIAKQINSGIPMIFKELDKNELKYLNKRDIKLILEELNIKCQEKDILLLMKYLGNGQMITLESIGQVIQIQIQS